MAEEHADWSSNSNDAFNIHLVRPGAQGVKTLNKFNPKFTYPVFGDEEQIFGYKGLRIHLRYNACDMRPNLQIEYDKKFKAVGETEPTDIKQVLAEFLPKTAFDKSSAYESAITGEQYAKWSPPGKLWRAIEDGGKKSEVWMGSLSDPAIQQLVKRIHILIPLFIEGGTMIDMDDVDWSLERWTVFFLYEKRPDESASTSPYVFQGYSTVYRYFHYQVSSPSEDQSEKKPRTERPADLDFSFPLKEVPFNSLPCRSRISQFVILPPFQGGGNGSRFYNTIFDYYLQEKATIEITVEDPNEAFDDLRDLNDLTRLRKVPAFNALEINTKVTPRQKGPIPTNIVDSKVIEKLRTKMKIAPRQFMRVTEMHLLSKIPLGVRQSLLLEKPKATGAELVALQQIYRLWQLWVKRRLYKHNKDMLMQLDRSERIDKLEQALGGVEADYARLLRALETRSKDKKVGNGLAILAGEKRSTPMPEDGGSGDDREEGEDGPSNKRVKFS